MLFLHATVVEQGMQGAIALRIGNPQSVRRRIIIATGGVDVDVVPAGAASMSDMEGRSVVVADGFRLEV